jgi:acetyl esterase
MLCDAPHGPFDENEQPLAVSVRKILHPYGSKTARVIPTTLLTSSARKRGTMKTYHCIGIIVGFLLATTGTAYAADQAAITTPLTQYFAKRSGTPLKAIVYRPEGWRPREARPVVVIFHGLGWKTGEPEWGDSYAKHYQSKGMIAICAQYRLAQGGITPLDSMADARDAIRWIRANAVALGIDPMRIAAHGFSAGGHLAASAAVFWENTGGSGSPNALILSSPVLDVENDKAMQQLLGAKATAASVSPLSHMRPKMPPTIILQGDSDTVTPHAGAKTFCSKMVEGGNRCELNTYMYVGHLFTPKGTPDKTPKPDPRVEAAALEKTDAFLTSLGYMKAPQPAAALAGKR